VARAVSHLTRALELEDLHAQLGRAEAACRTVPVLEAASGVVVIAEDAY
jgi:hypothetical protein